MQNKKLFGAVDISSSQDPAKMAATVQGLIIGASSLIIFAAWQFFGVTIVAEQVSSYAVQVGLAVSSLVTLYGLIRKIILRLSW